MARLQPITPVTRSISAASVRPCLIFSIHSYVDISVYQFVYFERDHSPNRSTESTVASDSAGARQAVTPFDAAGAR